MSKNEERISVDLDVAKGRASTGRNHFYCVIKFTKSIRLEYLTAYLNHKASWDTTVLECMSKFVWFLYGNWH